VSFFLSRSRSSQSRETAKARSGSVPRLTFEKLEHHVGAAIGFAYVEKGQEIGVAEAGGGAGFPLEVLEPRGIAGHGVGDDLHRDVAPQARVARPVDLAHAPCSEGRRDLVGAETGARGQH